MLNFLRKTALWILFLPYVTFGVGAASNQLVLIANHDKFPVMWNQGKVDHYNAMIAAARAEGQDTPDPIGPDGMLDSVHCLMTDQTHLNFLADVFDMRSATYSVGDGLLYLGDWMGSYCLLLWGFLMVDKARKS